jgi:L-cysteine:1D-myo-inositol 2-amino-2-deoxy-alpha-D-glucopyranoside ligase
VTIHLFDTAQRDVVPFEVGPTVRMYVCGITPYDSTHLGHAATYLTYDLLIRRLEELGHDVRMVRNVTDVDDSILPKARELGVPYLELAEAELARFRSDMDALGTRPPLAEPRATESIEGMVDMVGRLIEAGNAYEAHGTVYFDVSTFPDYGKVSHYSRDEMVRLARERGGNPDDPHRRHPLDFVLWQPSLPDEPAWQAPFGVGRPGWHVECSVMAMHELGPTLDLHGGGTDLIFPHHECEVAQSESITGEPFSRHWVHSAMVSYEGEKMSKSLGNLVFVSDLLKTADPRAIRLALMQHHYRAGFEWHDTDLDDGTALLHRLLAAAERPDGADPRSYAARVRAAIDDDLDAPRALAALDDLASAVLSGGSDTTAPAVLRELGALLGIDLDRPLQSGLYVPRNA